MNEELLGGCQHGAFPFVGRDKSGQSQALQGGVDFGRTEREFDPDLGDCRARALITE
jgi:hypothetical protein